MENVWKKQPNLRDAHANTQNAESNFMIEFSALFKFWG